MSQQDLDPIPPDAFDVDRPKPEEPVGYRDAAPEIPERFGHARGPLGKRARATGFPIIIGAGIALVLIGALFGMCAQHRRDLDQRKQMNAPGANP
ncbi:MAG: hypothetical protein ACXVEF_41745 [Polyangiales bacterium]